jgi:hypothetical protein
MGTGRGARRPGWRRKRGKGKARGKAGGRTGAGNEEGLLREEEEGGGRLVLVPSVDVEEEGSG